MIEGVRVGHWSDPVGRTGCTVVLLPEGTVASGEVRGGAPATRELELLEPTRMVPRLDAVILTGGSAYGLGAADGVLAWLEERLIGITFGSSTVPIVVGMGIYDLAVGDPSVRPGPAEGRAACEAAAGEWTSGRVGAGTGATVAKYQGTPRDAGIGVHVERQGEVAVAAIVVVNAAGDVDAETQIVDRPPTPPGQQTTIGVIVTNARLTKTECLVVAQGGHDGMARALWPPHMTVDGDALVAGATGTVDASLDLVRAMAVLAVEHAVRAGARS